MRGVQRNGGGKGPHEAISQFISAQLVYDDCPVQCKGYSVIAAVFTLVTNALSKKIYIIFQTCFKKHVAVFLSWQACGQECVWRSRGVWYPVYIKRKSEVTWLLRLICRKNMCTKPCFCGLYHRTRRKYLTVPSLMMRRTGLRCRFLRVEEGTVQISQMKRSLASVQGREVLIQRKWTRQNRITRLGRVHSTPTADRLVYAKMSKHEAKFSTSCVFRGYF